MREAWARLALGDREAVVALREAWAGIDRAGASSTDASQRLFFVNGLIEAGEYAEALAQCDEAEKAAVATGESGLLGEIGRYRSYTLQSLTWRGAIPVARVGIAAPKPKMDADGNFVDPGTIAEIEQAAQRLVDASTLPREEILALARRIVRDAGIEDVHLAAQE